MESAGQYINKYEYFDGFDRSVKTVSYGIDGYEQPLQILTTTTYDNMGRKDIVYGPYFQYELPGLRYYEDTDYDKLGRVIFIRSPKDQSGALSTITYNYLNPFTTEIIDPDNKKKTEKRDHLGRIIQVIEHADEGDQTTGYSYNAAGDMLQVQNAIGIPTIISYDLSGLKTGMDDPDMGEWDYEYSGCMNLLTQKDAKLNTITFGYDALNRILSKNYTIISHPIDDPNYTQATPNVEYRYDGYGLSSCTNCIGQLTSVNNTSVVTIYDEYDKMGRVKNTTKTITGDQPRTTYTEYDFSGKITYITHLTNSVIDFVTHNTYYPGTGLLNTVTGTPYGGSATEYAKCTEYEPTGKIGRVYHAYNDMETVYTYDLKSTRLAHLLTTGAGGDIQEKSYTYSAAGDISKVTDLRPGGFEYTYTYDNLHRLKSETSSDTAPPTSTETLIYAYNNPDHINAVSSIEYNGTNYYFTYDNNGNMRQGWDFTNGSIVSRDITWNADNMPVTVTRGGTQTTLTYDGNGVRAKKVAGGTTTYYIGNDYEIKNGTHIKSIFAGNMRIAEIEGTTATIFHKDHLGSSIAMTDSAGAKVEGTEYLPFGGMRAHTGSDVSDYKFTDQELDKSSNLYNYDARLYDPVIGRFVSADSEVPKRYDPQMLNRYSYVRNNPLVYIDPNGHEPNKPYSSLALAIRDYGFRYHDDALRAHAEYKIGFYQIGEQWAYTTPIIGCKGYGETSDIPLTTPNGEAIIYDGHSHYGDESSANAFSTVDIDGQQGNARGAIPWENRNKSGIMHESHGKGMILLTPSGWVIVKGVNTGSFIIMWDMPSDPLNPQNNGNNAFDDTKYKDDPGAIKDQRCPECQRENKEPPQPKKKDWWRDILRRAQLHYRR